MQRSSISRRVLALACVALVVPAGLAMAQAIPGGGFLRGGFGAACLPTMLCSIAPQGGPLLPAQAVSASAPTPVVQARQAVTVPGAGATASPVAFTPFDTALPEIALTPNFSTGTALGASQARGGVTTEISLGLRAQFGLGGQSPGLSLVAVPQAGIAVDGARLDAQASARVELVLDVPEKLYIGAAELAGGASYALDSLTDVSASARLGFSRDAGDEAPGAVMTAPLAFSAEAALGAVRTVGRNVYAVDATLLRESTSDGERADGTIIDNAASHLTQGDLKLRMGREISPALVAFGTLGVTRTDFDLVEADNWLLTAGAGISGAWRGLSGEASVGAGWRDYDAAARADEASLYFAASIAYAPISGLTLEAGLESRLLPGEQTESGQSAQQSAVTLGAAYRASSWLGLTADASYLWELDQSGDFAFARYGAGLGAEITWIPNATIMAGYGFTLSERAGEDARDDHRFTLGVTVQP